MTRTISSALSKLAKDCDNDRPAGFLVVRRTGEMGKDGKPVAAVASMTRDVSMNELAYHLLWNLKQRLLDEASKDGLLRSEEDKAAALGQVHVRLAKILSLAVGATPASIFAAVKGLGPVKQAMAVRFGDVREEGGDGT